MVARASGTPRRRGARRALSRAHTADREDRGHAPRGGRVSDGSRGAAATAPTPTPRSRRG